MDEGWEEVSPEDMSAAAELLAEEMQVIKAAMQVQASTLVPFAFITTTSLTRAMANGPRIQIMCLSSLIRNKQLPAAASGCQ